eukprot:TRINITY_DN11424_c0_g1_i1.p2 TRINITY_DN11424_c0_g1~~TRINITY_DN11424_c0_g1_i1.p2  ORF type:complete len:620 (-),score=305.20 TRINITY_DN11424_c0_g1_i1:159-2018(-)
MATTGTEGSLYLESVIGFGGHTPSGLHLHPSMQHIVFPLGDTLCCRSLTDPSDQEFFKGCGSPIASCAVSPSGRLVAAGTSTHMGFLAEVVVWDYATRSVVHRLSLHKVAVAALAFSPSGDYLASVGGQDDNNLVIWDLATGKAVCKSVAASDVTTCVRFLHGSDARLVTGGRDNLSVWSYDSAARKLAKHACVLGKHRRLITSIAVDAEDEFMYCGTASGDLLQVSVRTHNFKSAGPRQRLAQGITSCALTPSGDILVGAGDGTVALLRRATLNVVRQTKVVGAVTSIALNRTRSGESDYFFLGTAADNIYGVALDDFTAEQKLSCHQSRVNDVAFPRGYSAVFGTCGGAEVRLWNTTTCHEMLRVVVPNLVCNCLAFAPDGGSIATGWSDGRIRAFGPQSGALMYTVQNAHAGGVTALAYTSDSRRLVSGGKDGTVRVWALGADSQTMVTSMKEHRAPVNSVHVRDNDRECLSSSDDGSCVIWDLVSFKRSANLFASTHFKDARYFPDASQILTTGTDRKITYWDTFDGANIREVEGSLTAEVSSLDIAADGGAFASGGGDGTLRLWGYDDGAVRYTGEGHAGGITRVRFSPDGRWIVSAGDEGGVFIWRNPLGDRR